MIVDMALDLALALDAATFARECGVDPDPWQERVLRTPSKRIILNNSRQSGKSTIAALMALHTAIYDAPSLILIVSRAERQSVELFRKVLTAYRTLGRPVDAQAETALRLELETGSRIIALPGSEETIRSYSGVKLLIIDEASRVADATYTALRPMLAVSGGKLALLSTPFGKRGFFYETWQHGGAVWHREEIPAEDCPRISADFLEEERAALGYYYPQEYENQFLDTTAQLFATDDIERAVTDDVTPLWG
jgi:hypothetical protein